MPTSDDTLAIEVWLLTGRFVATAFNDRTKTEWPPHFARVYSALVNEWAQAGRDKREASCLRWMETLGPPRIAASFACNRTTKAHFVPVNDVISPTSKSQPTPSELLAKRPKQERHFPSCKPLLDRVTYIWDTSHATHTDALRGLLNRVTRIGHSSSLTNCRLLDAPPNANLVPNDDGRYEVRTIGKGQFDALSVMFEHHQGNRPRALPFVLTRYAETQANGTIRPTRSTLSSEWIVYEMNTDSRYLPVTSSLDVASLFRRALFRYVDDPIPEVISGHAPDGQPTRKSHIGVVPIPNVSHEHADGRLLGLALSIPSDIGSDAQRTLFRALNRWETQREDDTIELYFGSSRTIRLTRATTRPTLVGLRRNAWSGTARQWISATPVALPRHPRKLGRGNPETRRRGWQEAEEIVKVCCEHAGFPRPKNVDVSKKPILAGATSVSEYSAFVRARPGRNFNVRRCLLHARVEFEEEVAGPMVLGAGQFVGLGLMRPVRSHMTPESH